MLFERDLGILNSRAKNVSTLKSIVAYFVVFHIRYLSPKI